MEKKTGFYRDMGKYWFVITKNPKEDFYVKKEKSLNAQNKDKVEIEIYPERLWKNREAIVTKIIPKVKKEDIKENQIIWIYRQKDFFWFVDVENKETWEKKWYYVYSKNTKNALDWDEVLATIKEYNWKQEAVIEKVLKRSLKIFVWTLEKTKNFWFVVLDNPDFKKDIFIRPNFLKNANSWDKVWVRIIKFNWKNPEWKIVKILWKTWERWVDILWVALEWWARIDFPEKVILEAKKMKDTIEKNELIKREDLTNLFIITIDWADSKDLDDAISVEKMPKWDYKLYVHIADVAHYVKEDSSIDKEALKRWNSIYLIDKVIPMLPEKLSNNLCSLNPDTIKLTLTCEVIINKKWEIIDKKVYESYIKSDFRMTYKEVEEIILEENELKKIWLKKLNIGDKLLFWENKKVTEKLINMLKLSEELRKIIWENKHKLWVLDFDFPEAKIIVDEKWFPVEIKKYPRYNSNKIIEEFMITANEAVSEKFSKYPFLYRVHTEPKEEDIEKLRKILNIFNINIAFEEITPKTFQILLEKIFWNPSFDYLQRIILRTMTKAYYDVEILWHFGLALNYYSHFTSPIRRYSDLQIHRIIKEKLSKKLNKTRIEHYKKILKNVAEICSEQEQFAVEMERKVQDIMFAKYMENHIWEEFFWKITWITQKWIFVELDNTIEGFVYINDKNALFDEELLTLTTKEKKYSLWQKIKIKVIWVDKIRWKIDFEEVIEEEKNK